MSLDLDIEELKILILSLSKKKENVTDDFELKKINERIQELSDTLKLKKQTDINLTFEKMKKDVDIIISNSKFLDEDKVEMTVSDFDILKSIQKGFMDLYSYQQEIQNCKNPENYYFDFLIIPISGNVRISSNQNKVFNQVIPTIDTSVTTLNHTVPSMSNINLFEGQNKLTEEQIRFLQQDKIPHQQNGNFLSNTELASMRSKLSHYFQTANYERAYMLLKDDNMKIRKHGFEDILNKLVPEGGTFYEKIKNIAPVTDEEYQVIEHDTQTESSPQIHFSTKAQEIIGGDILTDSNVSSKPNGLLSKLTRKF